VGRLPIHQPLHDAARVDRIRLRNRCGARAPAVDGSIYEFDPDFGEMMAHYVMNRLGFSTHGVAVDESVFARPRRTHRYTPARVDA
jgi:hypothetical protein